MKNSLCSKGKISYETFSSLYSVQENDVGVNMIQTGTLNVHYAIVVRKTEHPSRVNKRERIAYVSKKEKYMRKRQ